MSFADQTINEFLEDVAATTVTPSGGAVAAMSGASGAALCEMVCIHTIEQEDYSEVRPEMVDIRDDLETQRVRLLELADEDSIAVDELQAAFEIPREEDRAELIQEASHRTTEVPLEVAERCLNVLEHARVVTAKGNRNTIADGGTGAFLAHSAVQASVLIVQSNLELIEDVAAVTEIEERSGDIRKAADEAMTQVKTNAEHAG
ncbi:cyclodeaminase/cyclohydrolase family protein [Halococcus sp. PRR34]|uniref:cyclodeaminase/cyclohydrolase family protein n=1 Tax=Halococcus sp. PRR34 TaxID=3020830 RepID=UPI00235F6F16|nr:cyclodeaminase/cyclohydrolase family protein [Halococcus sp. PRR34]